MIPNFDSGNPYRVLGVRKNSSQKTIKKAFRDLSKKYHPDKGGDPEVFRKISEAYEILSDENKRAHFDKTGNIPKSPNKNTEAFRAIAVNFEKWIESEISKTYHWGDEEKFENRINIDIALKMKNQIKDDIQEFEAEGEKLKKRIDKLDKILKRCKGGFYEIVESKVNQAEELYQNGILKNIKILNDALEMLNDGAWCYIFDEENPHAILDSGKIPNGKWIDFN